MKTKPASKALDSEQRIQEEEYAFPYHHVVSFRRGFRQSFHDAWGINYAATIELLIELLGRQEFRTLVDVGCGDGRLVDELMREFPKRRIVGVDYSRRAIDLARAMVPGGDFVHADIGDPDGLRSLQGPFDRALLVEVLEHIPPAAAPRFLMSVRQLLGTEGELIVTVPHVNKPTEPKHYRHFTSASITSLLGEGGFLVTEVTPFERRTLVKRLLDAVLGNRLLILNERRTLDLLYRFYKRRLLRVANEGQCARLLVTARPAPRQPGAPR
jgi:SAM-dependent methyltransferase